MPDMTTDGRRIEYAPQIDGGTSTTGVVSVALRPDEWVQWLYDPTHTRVTGYMIHKRKEKNTFLLAC